MSVVQRNIKGTEVVSGSGVEQQEHSGMGLIATLFNKFRSAVSALTTPKYSEEEQAAHNRVMAAGDEERALQKSSPPRFRGAINPKEGREFGIERIDRNDNW